MISLTKTNYLLIVLVKEQICWMNLDSLVVEELFHVSDYFST